MDEAFQPLMPRDPAKLLAAQPTHVRAGFIRKVYSVLAVQLLATALLAAPLVLSESAKEWVRARGVVLVVFAVVLYLAFFLMILCLPRRHMRTYPHNFLILAGFTITEGFLIGVICTSFTLDSVLASVFATSFLVVALMCFAAYTKTDFTSMGGYLFASCMVLMTFGFFCMFFPFPIVQTLWCGIGLLVFSMYLIHDTQKIVGKRELAIGIDDYVMATLQLYVDIVELFLFMVQLFGSRN